MTASAGRLVILGLGPGDPGERTVAAQAALDAADRIILRTSVHPGLDDLATDTRVSSCDDLYESAAGFDALYAAIAERVIANVTPGELTVYAVPGHPRMGERTVPFIESRALAAGNVVEVLDAVSFIDASLAAVPVDPLDGGLQIADAEHLSVTLDREPHAAGLLGIDPALPLLIAQIYNGALAAAVKMALSRLYPDDHAVTLIQAAGVPEREGKATIALHELDRQGVDHLTSLFVPPLNALDAVRTPRTLTRVVATLRAPGGCPWDRAQTHATLRNAVLEEAYEAVDAIDSGDLSALAEELGDLLLLVLMHAQIAEEDGAFAIEDVYESVTRKLIRRHPHVFGAVAAETPDAVVATWDAVKAAERAAKGAAEPPNPIDRLPRAMPATRKAIELLAPRAALERPALAHAGDDLLAAIEALIAQGIDPERAIEDALRRRGEAMAMEREPVAAAQPMPGGTTPA